MVLLSAFTPRSLDERVYHSTRHHEAGGTLELYTADDPRTAHQSPLERTIVGYTTRTGQYAMLVGADFQDIDQMLERRGTEGDESYLRALQRHLHGLVGERIARRVTKDWLSRIGARFSGISAPDYRSSGQNLVAHSEEYILGVERYPNLIIWRREQGGYKAHQELDGLFDMRFDGEHTIMVVEAKTGIIPRFRKDSFEQGLVTPLRQLFPDASLAYVLFGTRDELFDRRSPRARALKAPTSAYVPGLAELGVQPIIHNFDESPGALRDASRHAIEQYRLLRDRTVVIPSTVKRQNGSIFIWGQSSVPYLALRRIGEGLWREVRPHSKKRVDSDGLDRT